VPTYSIVCDACKHAFEAFHKIQEPHPPCEKCGAATHTSWAHGKAPALRGTEFHGKATEAIDVMAQPKEVKELRSLFGGVGHCWQDDGSVKFANPSEARKFYAKEASIKAKFSDQKAAGKLPTKREKREAAALKRLTKDERKQIERIKGR
jgi:putative FmdB family regulatory protein